MPHVLFVRLSTLYRTGPARDLWPWPWFLPPPPEPSVKPHSIPKLRVEEIPAPSVPSKVNWFSALNKKYHSAVLIAGSNGYRNYRHQADVCHAYRILRERGLQDDNIITFVYDDIAYDKLNPYQGQIFNGPGMCRYLDVGRDVDLM